MFIFLVVNTIGYFTPQFNFLHCDILGCNIDHGMVGLRGSIEVILMCSAS